MHDLVEMFFVVNGVGCFYDRFAIAKPNCIYFTEVASIFQLSLASQPPRFNSIISLGPSTSSNHERRLRRRHRSQSTQLASGHRAGPSLQS